MPPLLRFTALATVAVLALMIGLAGPRLQGNVERRTTGTRVIQFYRTPGEQGAFDDMVGIAHNAGDSVGTALQASLWGADIVEFDVMEIRGNVRAAHERPVTWVPSSYARDINLAEAWAASSLAGGVLLDLKVQSESSLEQLVAFLDERPERPVTVTTSRLTDLEYFADHYPAAVRILSLGTVVEFRAFQQAPPDPGLVEGVTVRQSLLDRETVDVLRRQGFLVLAWTVNDWDRARELADYGVQAISTDNLGLLAALGRGGDARTLVAAANGALEPRVADIGEPDR